MGGVHLVKCLQDAFYNTEYITLYGEYMPLVFVSINYLLSHSQKIKSHILLEFV